MATTSPAPDAGAGRIIVITTTVVEATGHRLAAQPPSNPKFATTSRAPLALVMELLVAGPVPPSGRAAGLHLKAWPGHDRRPKPPKPWASVVLLQFDPSLRKDRLQLFVFAVNRLAGAPFAEPGLRHRAGCRMAARGKRTRQPLKRFSPIGKNLSRYLKKGWEVVENAGLYDMAIIIEYLSIRNSR